MLKNIAVYAAGAPLRRCLHTARAAGAQHMHTYTHMHMYMCTCIYEMLTNIAVYAEEARCAAGLLFAGGGFCHSFSVFCSWDSLICSLSLSRLCALSLSCSCVCGGCSRAVVVLVGDLSVARLLVLSYLFSFLLYVFALFALLLFCF
jgi:hypothetical protein